MSRIILWRPVAVLLAFAATAVPMLSGARAADAPSGSPTLGKSVYNLYCSSCHGPQGRGDGSLAKTLRPEPGDLTGLALANGGTFPSERVTRIIDGRDKLAGHVRGQMPVWGDAFAVTDPDGGEASVARRIADLTAYLASIQRQSPAP